MRILITTDWYRPVINGVVTSVINLETELRKMGHDVRILTLSQNMHANKRENVYCVPSVPVGKIYPSARLMYKRRRDYLKEIMDWKPEIIHSQCEFSSFVLARYIASRLDIPIVHTYHTVYEDYTHYFAPREKWGKHIAETLSRRILSHTERVIVPTEKVRQLLSSYGVTQPIDVIPSGIDLSRFHETYTEKQLQEERARLGIPASDKIIVYVGRMAKEKNVEELIDYFNQAKMEGISLLLVGGGPFLENLQKKARESGLHDKIFFTGMVTPDQVSFYYHMGEIFVCASNSETQGITYAEALASGCVPLCKKDPCIDNLVINDLTGFQYEDYDSFEHALNRMLTEKPYYHNLEKNGPQVAENLGTELFAKRVMTCYEQALQA